MERDFLTWSVTAVTGQRAGFKEGRFILEIRKKFPIIMVMGHWNMASINLVLKVLNNILEKAYAFSDSRTSSIHLTVRV